jgi:hypothetical protein
MSVTDVLLYFVPAFLVLVAMFLVINKFLNRDISIRLTEAKHQKYKDTLPLRLQAYERLCVFLERISPPALLPRVLSHSMSGQRFRSELVSTINSEFEHNFSQQVYITPDAWKSVRAAKEETIHLIHSASDKLHPDATAMQLSAKIYEHISKAGSFPSENALIILRAEAAKLI